MVATRAGVSTATVSRVLSNPEIVVPKTRLKVQEAIEALGYAPNAAAKSLRTLRTSKIIVMVPDISNPFFSEVLQRAEDMAGRAGYSVLLGDTRNDKRREDEFANVLLSKEADGLIFLGHRMPTSLVNLIKQKGADAPIVNACDYSPALGVPSVNINNVRAAYQAMTLLYSTGHRRIAVITGPADSNITHDRLKGVSQAAAAAQAQDSLLIRQADYTIEDGARETALLIGEEWRPTAIFCFSDEIAIGALASCRNKGIVCPRDISIVGFDDIRYARFLDPPLTTVRQPMNLIGQTAVQMLLAILEGRALKNDVVTLEHDLIVRGSTGVARMQ